MKRNRWKLLTLLIAAVVLITTVTLSVYAYFSTRIYVYTDDGKEVAHLGMNLQLLFGKLDQTLDGTALPIPYYAKVDADGNILTYDKTPVDGVTYHNAKLENPEFDPDAPWGSPQNPYIIANERHLQNLSALQNIGYFDLMYISENFTNGTYNNGISMPYFLVCDENGKPTVIDASEIGTIKPVGSAEHPFIGVVGGAFVEGSATVAGKTTTVSAFHNVKVQTTTDQTDVGLFGYVGYLGDAPADGATETVTDANGNEVQVLIDDFEGAVSILQNFTLSDVQIKVNQPSILEKASEWIAHVFNDHRFTDRGYANDADVPHENHHIGILAGHVSYASVEYISVYYSDENICAIDLLHTTAAEGKKTPNYHSTTGILGFMHNMNSSVTNQTDTSGYIGNCLVSVGGTSSDGITLVPGGQGTGGGKEIGIGRGYVMAKTLYDGFHFVAENQSMYDRIWSFKVGAATQYGMMFFQDENGEIRSQYNNTVTISNGTAVETLSNGTERTYSKYVIRTLVRNLDDTVEEVYTFYNASTNGTVIDKYDCEELPQTIWQYVAEKPVDESGFPIEDRDLWEWTQAVLLVEQSDGSYTLTDKKTKVTVEGTTAKIDGALAANNQPATIASVFFLRTNGQYSLTATGDVVAPVVFHEKPLFIQTAQNRYGTDLCEPVTEGITLGGEQGYYFYDGVFTFALSSSSDTIEDVWENETPDSIVLGPNEDASWKVDNSKGNLIVIAYINPVTTPEEWEAVAASGKEIFIGYHDVYSDKGTDDNGKEIPDWTSEQVHLMTLAESSTTNDDAFGNDFFKTTSNTKSFISSTDYNSLITGMENDEPGVFPEGYSDEQKQALLNGIRSGDIQILNLETGDIEELQNKYRIKPTTVTGGYEFAGVTADNYKLSLLYRKGRPFWGSGGTDTFSIWCGASKPQRQNILGGLGYYEYEWSTVATVQQNGDVFQISYTIQHVNGTNVFRSAGYNSGEDKFQGYENAQNLYFYTIETMTTADFGSVTIEPVNGEVKYDPENKTGNSFSADQYILWPEAVMTPDGTLVAGENFNDPYTLHASGNGVYTTGDFKTDGDLYDTYKLVGLSSLISGDNGWQNGLGELLSQKDLRKKFTMQEALNFSLSLKIPGIDNIQLGNGSVVAPVGPGGALANIPSGSIAFRINKTGTSKIRVIVSVPVSAYYDGYDKDPIGIEERLLTEVDYYLGLWKTEDLNDEEWSINTFNMGSAEQKFELPRSRPYDPETATPATANYILVDHGGTKYRSYLNGDRVLVGYEFTVTEPGTYIVGTTAGRWSLLGGLFGTNIDNSYPMEIVYCSADGTASSGRDGTSTSIYGSIDYVYEHDGKIVHVQDYPGVTLPTEEDYQYYYSSHVITYTDNKLENGNTFVSINDLQICVQRAIDTGQNHSAIYLTVKSPLAGEFTCKTAGVDPDDIHVTHEGQRTPTN